jgi:signal transduction histidine kinase
MGLVGTGLAAVLSYVVTRSRAGRRDLTRLRDLSAAKDRFLASVGHEIRTPLTSVLGLAGVLAREWHSLPADEVQDLLDVIEEEGSELADRMDDLLTIGNITSGTLTVRSDLVDLEAEIEHVVSRMVVPAGKEVRESGEMGIVVGDRLRIRQILRNLCSNALRYADRSVRIIGHREGDRVEVRVSNDGPPLDEEKQSRVFQPYLDEQLPGQPASIGAGLWISRTLAEAMGGGLTYRYRDGHSMFTLALPAHGTGEPAVSAAEQSVPLSSAPLLERGAASAMAGTQADPVAAPLEEA